MPRTPENWLHDNGYGEIQQHRILAGGCINEVSRLHTARGTVILKQNSAAPMDMFAAEASGLNALAATDTIQTPGVLHHEANYLLLEDLGQSSTNDEYWHKLGEQLAQLHSRPQSQFGFTEDNYCGATAQLNTPTENGYGFFAECRLLALGHHAFDASLLGTGEMRQLEFVASHLDTWIPQQAPSLIHGDLWSGNIHCDEAGQPALIDPACYWGWAEAEMAMTCLFGGFAPAFYDAYAASSQMDDNWQERASLYNLYHLLNHLLLFGGSYLQSIRSILNRYGD